MSTQPPRNIKRRVADRSTAAFTPTESATSSIANAAADLSIRIPSRVAIQPHVRRLAGNTRLLLLHRSASPGHGRVFRRRSELFVAAAGRSRCPANAANQATPPIRCW